MQEAVVFGAGGQMGRAVALTLIAAGWRVRAVTRGGRALPAGLHGAIAVDGTGQSRAQVIGAGADAVFDPLCMDAAGAGELLAARGAVGRFVVISTAAVYADAQGRCLERAGDTGFPQFDRPITEAQATVAPGAGYGPAKVAMEQALLSSGAPVAVLRPGAILIVNVPAAPGVASHHDERQHVRRRYTRQELRGLLVGGGFRGVQQTPWNADPFSFLCV